MVAGEGKAEAVAQALATGDDSADVHDIPAVGVHGQERTVWFLDEGAASMLPASGCGPRRCREAVDPGFCRPSPPTGPW